MVPLEWFVTRQCGRPRLRGDAAQAGENGSCTWGHGSRQCTEEHIDQVGDESLVIEHATCTPRPIVDDASSLGRRARRETDADVRAKVPEREGQWRAPLGEKRQDLAASGAEEQRFEVGRETVAVVGQLEADRHPCPCAPALTGEISWAQRLEC